MRLKETVNYKLKKPDGNDNVNIEDLNYNADVVDSELNKKVPNSRKVNGKTLDSDVGIDVVDIPGLNNASVALGSGATANERYSVAIGKGATANNTFSIALGNDATANSSLSIALGSDAKTNSSSSIALGSNTTATSIYSVAIGKGVTADNFFEGVLGSSEESTTNKWKVPGDFSVSGTKNFEIPHPKPEKSATHVIRHGAVESPTPGDTLYRWKIQATKDNDTVAIDLPDYFIYLNKNVQIFVTPQGHFGNGYGELNRETEQLEIHCQTAGKYNVLAMGTRNDNHQSVQDWDIKGVEREIGESWTGETYAFSIDEIMEVEEIKEAINEYNYKIQQHSI